MNSATLVFLEPKTMINVVTRTASCVKTKALSAATRTRLAVKTASLCKLVWSVEKLLMQRANRKRDVLVVMLIARSHRRWVTERFVKNVANAGQGNVFHTAKPKVFRAACAMSLLTLARDAAGCPSMKLASQLNQLTFFKMERLASTGSATKEFARRRFKTWLSASGTSSKRLTSTEFSDSFETTSSVSILATSLSINVHHSLPSLVAVVTITTLFWIPSSCLISYFDRRARHAEMKDYNWKQQLDLIHPESDRRRVIHIRVPRQKITVTARM